MNPLINQSKNLAKHGITNLFAIKLRERERERERENNSLSAEYGRDGGS
jgi:hypothetical protein